MAAGAFHQLRPAMVVLAGSISKADGDLQCSETEGEQGCPVGQCRAKQAQAVGKPRMELDDAKPRFAEKKKAGDADWQGSKDQMTRLLEATRG